MDITEEIIKKIRDNTDIVEIISSYVALTQRGKNYFGVCPFHDDHSPSMSVSPERQIYTCFSCGASGNVFNFVANYEHIGFYDAVRMLGSRIGIDLGVRNNAKSRNAEAYQIYETACKFYQNNLSTVDGTEARKYLTERQIDKSIIKKFKIGLSTQRTSLTDYLLKAGHDLKQLVDLGLSTDNGKDLFVNRIMFPLFDRDGNVIAFSGRIYNSSTSESKYINTKETSIFKKGTILYNYHLAKEPLKKNDAIIVMEGFMDVIRASSVGIDNCIATMGTALTKQNAIIINKMAKDIILCFDGDAAGEKATTSAIEIFKELSVSPKVVRLEENLDPDDYIKKYGVEAFKNKINHPQDYLEFLMHEHRKDKNLAENDDIQKYIVESLNDLIGLDSIRVDLSIRDLSNEYQIPFTTLKERYLELVNAKQSKKTSEKIVPKPKPKKTNKYDLASRNIIYYMLKNDELIDEVENRIVFFPNETIRYLVRDITYYYHKYGTLKIADFMSYIRNKEEEYKVFSEILNDVMNEAKDAEHAKEEFEDYIKLISSYPTKDKIDTLKKKLHEEKDPTKQAEILNTILSLKGVK